MTKLNFSFAMVLIVLCSACSQKSQVKSIPKEKTAKIAHFRDPFMPASAQLQLLFRNSAKPVSKQDIRQDFSDYTVKDIQDALHKAGFYDGPFDGVMGKKTRQALQDFQRAHKLLADGKVGQNTWRVLSQFSAR